MMTFYRETFASLHRINAKVKVVLTGFLPSAKHFSLTHIQLPIKP